MLHQLTPTYMLQFEMYIWKTYYYYFFLMELWTVALHSFISSNSNSITTVSPTFATEKN